MRLYKRNGIYYLELRRGKSKSLKTRNRRLAQEAINDAIKEGIVMELTGTEGQRSITLEGFQREYLLSRKNRKAPNTLRLDTEAFDKLIAFFGPDTKLHEITPRQCEEFVTDLLERLKPSTVNINLRQLKAAFNKAVKGNYIRLSPLRDVEQIKVKEALPRALDQDEIKALLDAAEGAKHRFKEYIYTCLYTGGRRESVAKLEWQDFKAYTVQEQTHWTVTLKKTKGQPVTIPLAEELRKILFPRRRKSGPVFAYFFKHYREPSRFFKKVAGNAGLDDVRLHDLRHTAATFMVLKGVPLKMVQGILGHSTIKTTEKYTKVAALHLKEGIDSLKF